VRAWLARTWLAPAHAADADTAAVVR